MGINRLAALVILSGILSGVAVGAQQTVSRIVPTAEIATYPDHLPAAK